MHINDEHSDGRFPSTGVIDTGYLRRPPRKKARTLSMDHHDGTDTESIMARVKHTLDYNSRGCKGNTRGDFIHDSFITLEQVLTTLPLDIVIDIEISQYQRPFL
jgi:hypothetical protein